MNRQEIHAKLADIISQKIDKRIGVEQMKLDSRLREDLGVDSLSLAELLYDIEDVFGVTLDVERPEALLTMCDAVEAIAQSLRQELPLAG